MTGNILFLGFALAGFALAGFALAGSRLGAALSARRRRRLFTAATPPWTFPAVRPR
ncbi:hypothetical protein ACGFYV_06355 [Streptomyces sp. NPDC048297]|uniref:hypothetical protein n=1 Tax=Streptomyces sp. NPDC048297 TaxID=3365531 RepID=UPI00371C6CA3